MCFFIAMLSSRGEILDDIHGFFHAWRNRISSVRMFVAWLLALDNGDCRRYLRGVVVFDQQNKRVYTL